MRFHNPISQETAARAYQALVAKGYTNAATAFVTHRVKRAETLGMLAKKYGTTVPEIRAANGLRNNKIRFKQLLKIPKQDKLGRSDAVRIPPRRLPPAGGGKSVQR